MKTITIHHYAVLREQRGLSSETHSTEAQTLGGLYEELAAAHGFTLPTSAVKAAVNNSFTSMDEPFNDGDEIVFIPPVAGG